LKSAIKTDNKGVQQRFIQIQKSTKNFALITNQDPVPIFQGSTALRAGQLRAFHGDPADRMIVATAIENSATLITADKKILDWNKLHQKIDAST